MHQAPDWTADWLHRELTAWLELGAQERHQQAYADLDVGEQAALRAELQAEYRHNRVDDNDTLTVSERRAQAMAQTATSTSNCSRTSPHCAAAAELCHERKHPAQRGARADEQTKFFFWTAWATATERPNSTVTYTNNWPHEPLISNVPSSENVVWSIASVVILLAGVGFLVWGW